MREIKAKMKEKLTKKQRGITLIALVITIIVLLILAGVSIAMLTGENGILTQAQRAKNETETAQIQEQNILTDYEVYINNATLETATVGEIATEGNKKYSKNGTAIIPEGFAIVPGLDDVSQGLVISDVANDTEDKGNQFVWVPVEDFSEFVRHDFGNQGIEDSDFINTKPTSGKYYEPTPNNTSGCTSETASKWCEIFEELKVRGVEDIFFVSMDGLSGLPEAVEKIYPQAILQRCIVHITRNIYSILPKKEVKEVISDFKRIYTASNLGHAKLEYEAFKAKYKSNKKLMKKVEDNINWIIQIFEYPPAIRKLIYTTNSIESLNAGLRKVTKGKGSFINEVALIKVLYLRIQELKKKWSKQIPSWKQVQNELTGIFEERFLQYIEK